MFLKEKNIKSTTSEKSKDSKTKKPMSVSAEDAYKSNRSRKTSPKGY